METANVYGDLAADGIQRGLVGLRVGGLVRCEKKAREEEEMEKERKTEEGSVYTEPANDMDR